MGYYNIESVIFLGATHSGVIKRDGESVVELDDNAVSVLVDLIRQKGTTDVDALGVKESNPEIYDKLHDAYYRLAYTEVENQMLWEGYYRGDYEYDTDDLIGRCKQDCGFDFNFVYNEEEFLNDDGNVDVDMLEEARQEAEEDAFAEWLDSYINSLPDDKATSFFYNYMNAGFEMDDLDVVVQIPEAIISMAQGRE